MRRGPDISVVIPVYNEEECIAPLYYALLKSCRKLERTFEIVFIDDGSMDGTFEELMKLHKQDPRVFLLRFRRNFGQTAAMAAGFRAARGRVIVSMDGDLQNDPEDIPRLIEKIEEGYDIVCGWRKERKDKFLSRRLPSIIANWLIGKITLVPIHDNGCSLKGYRANVIKRVALYSEFHRFIPAMSTLTGARIAELVVRHHPRRFGKSKYGISRAWRVFLDLFVIKMVTGFSSRPALWFGLLSIPALILGVSCIAGIGLYQTQGIVLPASAFLFFALGGHLLTMGLLGEILVFTGDIQQDMLLMHTVVHNTNDRIQS